MSSGPLPKAYQPAPPPPTTLCENRELAEREIIKSALLDNHYNRVRAASALGVSRVTLYKKIKKYGLLEVPGRNGTTS